MSNLLQIRVTGDVIADLFTNGIKHYQVTNGLPTGYKFGGALRDHPSSGVWVLVFESEFPKENNELYPTFEYMK